MTARPPQPPASDAATLVVEIVTEELPPKSLNALGANPRLDEDAVYGDGTKTALKRFQAENGLKANGLPTRAAIAAIRQVQPTV